MKVKLLFVFLSIFLLLNLILIVSQDSESGIPEAEINDTGSNVSEPEPFTINFVYGPEQIFEGIINKDFKDKPADTKIIISIGDVSKEMTLLEFLDANSKLPNSDFTCSPLDCQTKYKTSGSGESQAEFIITSKT